MIDFSNPEEKKGIPICHFTPMEIQSADDYPNGTIIFWECKHCGHTKDLIREIWGT